MIDIRTSLMGRVIPYAELVQSSAAVWGGVAWPCGENIGSVIVIGAGHEHYDAGCELSILDEYESFDVRAMVTMIEAFDAQYWLSWPRIDYHDDPCGRWIGDETHEAAKEFLSAARERSKHRPPALGRARKQPQRLRLRPSRVMEMETPYEFLLPTLHNWLKAEHEVIYLKDSQAAMHLSQYEVLDKVEMSTLKLGHCPAIEALGFVAVELQAYLKRREQSKYLSAAEDAGKRSLHEV